MNATASGGKFKFKCVHLDIMMIGRGRGSKGSVKSAPVIETKLITCITYPCKMVGQEREDLRWKNGDTYLQVSWSR
eukprot:scaffold18769_cov85-Skeletonema_marinoi.AAC.1